MYVHGGSLHIAFNMFAFLMFGPHIEGEMGGRKFFLFYTLCGLFSAIFHMVITGIGATQLVGASGAVIGVVTAYAIFFPRRTIYVYFVPMPAFIAVILFAVIELFSGISGVEPGIANFGHLGGMVMAFMLVKFFNFKKKESPGIAVTYYA